MLPRDEIETIVAKYNVANYRWIKGADIQVKQWVRMKCRFGCSSYGKKGGCPPAVPSVAECREFFSEYENALVLHLQAKFENPEDRAKWSRENNKKLLPLERDVFLAGHPKAFLLFMDECRLCKDCPGTRVDCKNLAMARPCPEAFAVDVFSTVKSVGLSIDVLTDYEATMNRFALLMVE